MSSKLNKSTKVPVIMISTITHSNKKTHLLPSVYWAGVAVLLVGLNLRPAITSLAPVLKYIEADNGLSATVAGLLTSVPLIAFVTLSALVPVFARRIGYSRTIMYSLFILLGGFLLRIVPGSTPLFISMALAGVAITVGNVLLPAYIKHEYPGHAGSLTAIYTVSLYLGPALAAFATIPLMDAFGSWRLALLSWGAFVLLAVPFWWPHYRVPEQAHNRITEYKVSDASSDTRPPASHTTTRGRKLWSDPLAWAVAAYFAILSVLFYTLSAWLPTLLVDQGMDITKASQMLSLVNLAAIPQALVISIALHRTASQVWAALAGSVLLLGGLLGILFGDINNMAIWMIIFGFGNGTASGVAFSLPLLRTRTSRQTAALGAMAQVIGYSFSATGPALAGILRDLTPYWSQILLSLLIAMVVLQAVAGWFAGRGNSFVGEN